MNKKLIALAVAGAFAAPFAAQADSSNVTIYGHFHNSWDFTDANPNPSTGSSRKNDASNNSSNIGFKGSEDLGNGLKAGFVIESSLGEDHSSPSAVGNVNSGTNSGFVGSRNTFATIGGSWGTYLIGKVDNTYKASTARLDPFSETIGDYNTVISQVNGANLYDTRVMHAGAYITPTWNGFTAVFGYVPSIASATFGPCAAGGAVNTQNTCVPTGQDNNNNSAWAGTVMYDNGPLYLSASHVEAKIPTFTSQINSTKFGAGYSFGDIKLGGVYEVMRDPNGVGILAGGVKAERDALVLNVSGSFTGDNAWAIQYGRANDLSATTATGATYWTAGAWHHFSKRTSVYAVYAKLNNSAGASYALGVSGHGDTLTGGGGSSPSALSFGVVHDF